MCTKGQLVKQKSYQRYKHIKWSNENQILLMNNEINLQTYLVFYD